MKQKILNERRKNDFYRTLFDNAYEAILIIDIEDNAQIIDANTKALELFGYSYEELTSLSLFALSDNPDLTKQRIVDRVFEVGQTYYKKKDGTKIPIKARISRITISERFIAIMVIYDLSPEKNKDDALIASEVKYRTIVEDLVELICRFTPDGILTFVNKAYCNFFGKDYKHLIGTKFMTLISDEDKSFVEESFKSITKENPCNRYERKVIMSNGEIKWLRWSDRGIFSENGCLKEFQSIGFDVTDQHNLEEKIKYQSELYEDLQNNMTLLVEDMNKVNISKQENITKLEKAFGKSVEEFHLNTIKTEAVLVKSVEDFH